MNEDKEFQKMKEIEEKGKNIHNNNYLETPHFLLSPKSINSNDYKGNENELKNNFKLLSQTLPKQSFANSLINLENYKNMIDLKKKIISQSSTLLHNERRMINLANALNKINNLAKVNNNKSKDNSMRNNIEEEEKEYKNISYTHVSKNSSRIGNNKGLRYLNFDKRIVFGENLEPKSVKGKYPEPSDIDKNLVIVNNKNNDIFKNNNAIKIENFYENRNKNDDSSENLYFINNRVDNCNNNSNYNKTSTSLPITKDFQNINSLTNKNNSNYVNENINEITYLKNTSIGEQISYLENNINKFEKNFAI